MITTTTLAPGITLRCFRDSRFKQNCLSFQLVRCMQRQEAALNALLPAVLLRGTRTRPTMGEITRSLDDLYGAAISTLVRRVGDYQTVGLFLSGMEDRFALPGDRILAPALELLGEVLLEPRTEKGGFCPEFVESEKQNLIATIEAELNDKRAYAMGRLLRFLCQGDTFAIPRLGEKEDIPGITPQILTEHYRRILRESPIEIFYAGSCAQEEIARMLQPILSRIPRDLRPLPGQGGLKTGAPGSHREQLDVSQGKLCLGFTTPITNRTPEFPAMQVLNTLYGAGMTSKLFLTLREQLSLCYSIGSGYYGTKGILTVAAGIDFSREEAAKAEILHQLELCRQGEITDAELDAARQAILSSLRATHDSPGSIEGYYATAALSGMGMTPSEYSAAVEQVTMEQVVEAANTLELHTEYFLHG